MTVFCLYFPHSDYSSPSCALWPSVRNIHITDRWLKRSESEEEEEEDNNKSCIYGMCASSSSLIYNKVVSTSACVQANRASDS